MFVICVASFLRRNVFPMTAMICVSKYYDLYFTVCTVFTWLSKCEAFWCVCITMPEVLLNGRCKRNNYISNKYVLLKEIKPSIIPSGNQSLYKCICKIKSSEYFAYTIYTLLVTLFTEIEYPIAYHPYNPMLHVFLAGLSVLDWPFGFLKLLFNF